MSYDVELKDAQNNPCIVANFQEGGTQPIGGSEEASLNITYNYSFFYYHFLDHKEGLNWLNGKLAKDCISRLDVASELLCQGPAHDDYWAATPANAGKALAILLGWARKYPEAKFEVH